MSKILNVIGILLTTGGTVFTIWSALTQNIKTVGTWGEPLMRAKNAKKDKCKVVIGCVLIMVGAAFQIFGQFC